MGCQLAPQRGQRTLDLLLRQERHDGIAGGGPVEQRARDLWLVDAWRRGCGPFLLFGAA